MEDALPGIIAENIRNVSNASHAITGAQQVLKDVTLIHATICSGHPGDVRSSDLESFRKKSGSCMLSRQNRTLCFSPPPPESDAFRLQGTTGTQCPSHAHLAGAALLNHAGLKPSLPGPLATAGAMHLIIHRRDQRPLFYWHRDCLPIILDSHALGMHLFGCRTSPSRAPFLIFRR